MGKRAIFCAINATTSIAEEQLQQDHQCHEPRTT